MRPTATWRTASTAHRRTTRRAGENGSPRRHVHVEHPAPPRGLLRRTGAGAVLHTINIRLFPEQVAQIIDDAQDSVLLVDASLWDALAPVLAADRPCAWSSSPDHWTWTRPAVGRCRGRRVRGLPGGGDAIRGDVEDETAPAAMCYTSGTTGAPKGVVYSHRSVYLHAMANLTAAGFAIGDRDRLLQVVPMFHANGWGFPYAAWLAGASLILPDRYLQPEVLTPLIAVRATHGLRWRADGVARRTRPRARPRARHHVAPGDLVRRLRGSGGRCCATTRRSASTSTRRGG